KAHAKWREGESAAKATTLLRDKLPTLEGVLRIRAGLNALAAPLQAGVRSLLDASVPPTFAQSMLRRAVLAVQLSRRLDAAPALRAIDARRLQTMFARYREQDERKHTLVRDMILHRWVSRHRSRLLVSTGSRLNGAGAELRRRLTTRGKHALRLRQV